MISQSIDLTANAAIVQRVDTAVTHA